MKIYISILLAFACLLLVHAGFAQSGTIITIAGIDSFGYNGDNRPAITAKLSEPNTICRDRYGNVYVADAYNHRIRKIDVITGIITTVAGKDSSGYSGDNGPATNAKLFVPDGVAVDTFCNIYIADRFNNRVRKVSALTGIISTIAGTGISGAGGNGGPAISAQLHGPTYVHVSNHGDVYIVDYDNYLIRKISAATGNISTVAGTGVAANSIDGLPATNAALNYPCGVCIDDTGNVYISEQFGNKVRKVSATTGLMTTFAGYGIADFSGNGGPATAAGLDQPAGLTVDKNGFIFIADYQNGAIRKVDPYTGIITTVAGTLGAPGYAGDNGPATVAKMMASDVQLDTAGNIYIADFGPHRIRKVCYDTLCLKIPVDTADTPSHLNTINTVSFAQQYQLSPNPSDGDIVLTQLEADNDAVTIDVRDIVGKNVYVGGVRFGNRSCHLNLQHLSSGLYFMRVRDSRERVYYVRFVVE